MHTPARIGTVLIGAILTVGGLAAAASPATADPKEKVTIAKRLGAKAEKSNSNTAGSLLYNELTKMCADLPGYDLGTVDGPVNQYWCNAGAGDNQMWQYPTFSDGTFAIQNVKDGLCMDLPAFGSVPAATKVSEYHC